MANVVVMTDTVACIPKELAEEYRIRIVPASNIMVDGQSYIEGENISAEEAYQLIKKDPDKFVTSAIMPDYLLNVYKELSARSKEILFVTIASSLSAVSRTASIAADFLRERSPDTTVRILDSRACGSTQGLVVLAAARAAAQGKSLDEVASIAEQTRKKSGGLMMLDTLRYVYRTGRMSKSDALQLSMLNIRPINRVTDEGTIELVDSRTRKRADGLKYLLEQVGKEAGTDALHFMVTHAAAPEMAESFSKQLKQKYNCLSMVISDYSPVMGYGAGPGAIFVGFHPELNL
jgi:DegV family protein with EDD domain